MRDTRRRLDNLQKLERHRAIDRSSDSSCRRNGQRSTASTPKVGDGVCGDDAERPSDLRYMGAMARARRASDRQAAIQYWAEGYISGLAAGSRNDVLGNFRLEDLGAWLDRYCASNPQTKLPAALNALGREMLAHPGGKL